MHFFRICVVVIYTASVVHNDAVVVAKSKGLKVGKLKRRLEDRVAKRTGSDLRLRHNVKFDQPPLGARKDSPWNEQQLAFLIKLRDELKKEEEEKQRLKQENALSNGEQTLDTAIHDKKLDGSIDERRLQETDRTKPKDVYSIGGQIRAYESGEERELSRFGGERHWSEQSEIKAQRVNGLVRKRRDTQYYDGTETGNQQYQQQYNDQAGQEDAAGRQRRWAPGWNAGYRGYNGPYAGPYGYPDNRSYGYYGYGNAPPPDQQGAQPPPPPPPPPPPAEGPYPPPPPPPYQGQFDYNNDRYYWRPRWRPRFWGRRFNRYPPNDYYADPPYRDQTLNNVSAGDYKYANLYNFGPRWRRRPFFAQDPQEPVGNMAGAPLGPPDVPPYNNDYGYYGPPRWGYRRFWGQGPGYYGWRRRFWRPRWRRWYGGYNGGFVNNNQQMQQHLLADPQVVNTNYTADKASLANQSPAQYPPIEAERLDSKNSTVLGTQAEDQNTVTENNPNFS